MNMEVEAPTEGAGVVAGEAARAVEVRQQPVFRIGAANEVFNSALLKYYYANFFPFRSMQKWLSYGADPTSRSPNADFFHRREFTFTLEGDVFVRYQCFKDTEEFAREVMKRQPERIEIGPVYNARPSQKLQLTGDKFKPTERELIFDIDLNDYDDIRTCCTGANICRRCWSFINVAIKVLDATLRQDFGFVHILFVYSGRRGMHCWVSDEAARGMTNEQRVAVVEYINCKGDTAGRSGIGEGAANPSAPHITQMNRVFNALTWPLLPSFARAYADLEDVFVKLVAGEGGQGLLARKEQWTKVLDCIPNLVIPGALINDTEGFNLKQALEEKWPDAADSAQRWGQLKRTVESLVAKLSEKDSKKGGGGGGVKISPEKLDMRKKLRKLLPALVLSFCYPRLDVEVSKHRNHLLKAPFCIHPKTGRVCVPLSASMADTFDPSSVPTVAQLMREGMEWTARNPEPKADEEMGGGGGAAGLRAAGGARLDSLLWQHTSLRPYVEVYDAFVRELYASLRAARRQQTEAAAGAMGDW